MAEEDAKTYRKLPKRVNGRKNSSYQNNTEIRGEIYEKKRQRECKRESMSLARRGKNQKGKRKRETMDTARRSSTKTEIQNKIDIHTTE